jgi:hypothetical protein
MLRILKRSVLWILARLEARRLMRQTRGEIPRLRQYALEHCPAEVVAEIRHRREGKLVLAVVEGYPFLGYVRLGYDWKAPYYNPNLLFDEVHYLQSRWTPPLVLDLGYPFFVHSFRTAADVVRICRQHQVHVLRAYAPAEGEIAIEAANELNIPVVVSVH